MPAEDEAQAPDPGGWSWKGPNVGSINFPEDGSVVSAYPRRRHDDDHDAADDIEFSEDDAPDSAAPDRVREDAATGWALGVVFNKLTEAVSVSTNESDQLRLNIAAWMAALPQILGDAGLLDDPELSDPLQVLESFAASIEGQVGGE